MYISTHSLTSALDGGEWSASRPGRFTPRERAPGTHWIGDWVGPRAGLDVVVKKKTSLDLPEKYDVLISKRILKIHVWISVCKGTALGYGQDNRGSRVRFPAGAGNFSLHHRIQNGSGAHPASYTMDTRGSFPGSKAAGA
jgi:hypothetical protein